ncbi:LacI family DNA-binding transcriptional regulator [Marisediminicola senii]|uniref:LacI family DNA-binding transcriptional regulator n=1 Tax=Marisediminicola senii TaxID=2711233 RepID=UPI0013EA57D4|nr:LacI family DNA-binding transcriptional regulator [Marisediminicola senii]
MASRSKTGTSGTTGSTGSSTSTDGTGRTTLSGATDDIDADRRAADPRAAEPAPTADSGSDIHSTHSTTHRNARSGARGTPRITLRQVAERAGVSQATASKVLNGRSDVSDATRDRVLRIIDDAGYRRTVARPSEPGRSRITAVFDSLTSQYSSLILQGLVLAAAESDTDVVVRILPTGFASATPAAARTWVQENASTRGLIAVTSALPAEVAVTATRIALPLVTIDPVDSKDDEVVSISSTDWTGSRSVTEHIIELGHRRIGWVGGPAGSTPTIDRLRGFRFALEGAGLPDDRELHRNGPYGFEAGVQLGGELLDLAEPPTAILCGSDTIAFGVMEAARRRGLDLPTDLSVAGFDDIPEAEWANPKLTSVRAPLVGMGRMAAETVIALATGKEPASHHIELATRLVVRESTAAPR